MKKIITIGVAAAVALAGTFGTVIFFKKKGK